MPSFTERSRALHLQAKIIPKPIWNLFFNAQLSSISIECMQLPIGEVITKLDKLSDKEIGDKRCFWLAVAYAHTDTTEKELTALSKALKFQPRDEAIVASALGKKDYFQRVFDTGNGLSRGVSHILDALTHGAPTLNWLMASALGTKILKAYFEDEQLKKVLLQDVSFLQTLLARCKETAGALANTSALYRLSAASDGHKILATAFEDESFKKTLLHDVSFLPALLARRNETAGALANTSVLYWLSGSPVGQKILTTCLENEDLKKTILQDVSFLPALLARRNETAGTFANTSALILLSAVPEGRKILTPYFENEDFKKALLR